jgi:tetratricopeptide (TPR) repeat protein
MRLFASLLVFLLTFGSSFSQELRKGASGSGDDVWKPPAPPVRRNHPVRKPTPVRKTGRTTTITMAEPDEPTLSVTAAEAQRVDQLIGKGNAAIEARQFDEAEGFYKTAKEIDPEDWRPYMGLGNLYWDYGRRFDQNWGKGKISYLQMRYDEAVEAYQKAAQLNPNEPAIFVSLGFIYGDGFANRENDAIVAANRALRLKANFPEAHLILGQAYLNTERSAQAIAPLKEAIRLRPTYGRAYRLLGLSYRELKRNEEAIATYRLGVRNSPNYTETHYSLVSILVELKRTDEAIEVLKQLCLTRPTDSRPFAELGQKYYELRRYDEAVPVLKDAVRLNRIPKANKYPHVYLAETYMRLYRYDEAIVVWKELIKIEPALNPSDDWERLAFAYNQSGRYVESIEAAQQALKMRDDDSSAHNSLAFAYTQLGRYQEGINSAKRAIQLKPDFGNPHSHIAFAYMKMGRLNDALEEVKLSIKLAPRYPRAYYTLGLVQLALKNKTEAQEAHRQLESLDTKLAAKLLEEISKS